MSVKCQDKENQSLGLDFSCSYCGKFFRYKWRLSEHIRRHENKTPFKCRVCGAAFVKNSDLKAHLIYHSDEKPFKCRVCPRTFKSRTSRKTHEDIHGLHTYNCRFCEETFASNLQKKKHEASHKREKIVMENGTAKYGCGYCHFLFTSKEFKEEHESTEHKMKKLFPHIKNPYANNYKLQTGRSNVPFSCPFCLQKFEKHKNYKFHIKIEHPEEFENLFFKFCDICKKKVTTSFYKYHLMAHNGVKPHKCSHCMAEFSRKVELNKHLNTIHSSTEYDCSKCGRKVKSLKALKHHEKTHGAKTYTCNICDKLFHSNGLLADHHRTTHSTDIKTCQMCGKEVQHKFLRKHMRDNHKKVDQEPKLCDHCGVIFTNKSKLLKHLKVMSGDISESSKQYPCHYCNYITYSKRQVLSHCLQYHEEKVYRCILCSYSVLSEVRFENHMKMHRNNLSFSCFKSACMLENSKSSKWKFKEIPSLEECFLCGFIASYKSTMNKHRESHELYFKNYDSCNAAVKIKNYGYFQKSIKSETSSQNQPISRPSDLSEEYRSDSPNSETESYKYSEDYGEFEEYDSKESIVSDAHNINNVIREETDYSLDHKDSKHSITQNSKIVKLEFLDYIPYECVKVLFEENLTEYVINNRVRYEESSKKDEEKHNQTVVSSNCIKSVVGKYNLVPVESADTRKLSKDLPKTSFSNSKVPHNEIVSTSIITPEYPQKNQIIPGIKLSENHNGSTYTNQKSGKYKRPKNINDSGFKEVSAGPKSTEKLENGSGSNSTCSADCTANLTSSVEPVSGDHKIEDKFQTFEGKQFISLEELKKIKANNDIEALLKFL